MLCACFPWCLCLVDARVSSWGPWHCGRMYGDRFHQVLLMSARHEEALSSFKRWDKRIRHLWQYYSMSARLCVRVLGGERGGWGHVCVCNMRKACCAVHIGDIWGKLSFLPPHTLPPIPQLPYMPTHLLTSNRKYETTIYFSESLENMEQMSVVWKISKSCWSH